MNAILQFFSLNHIFFTLFGYSISYLEFIGTFLNLACVWLVARKHILNWPVGIIGSIFFGVLFYEVHLYADVFAQIYYVITGFWGWYLWQQSKKSTDTEDTLVVLRNSAKANTYWLVGGVAAVLLGGWCISNLHNWLPGIFPVAASLPFVDTSIQIASFAAQILMMQRKLENWAIWIAVDIVSIWMYWHKQVPFIALLYVVFLAIATSGFITWLKTYRRQHHEEADTRTGDREVLTAAQGA